MSGAAVTVDGIVKHFRTEGGLVRAVDGVSFELAAGHSLAITGPSGCGKSTLLALVGALEQPTRGSVEFDGEGISHLAERDRARVRREAIGFVFQSDNLQPFLTVVENVSLQLALSEHEGDGEHSVELLTKLGLGDALAKYPDQLSGGERQRVAVARALVHRPRLMLADEPTGALDTDNSATVVDVLLEAQTEAGATLVVISHDTAVAERFDHRLELRDGRLAGDPRVRTPAVAGGGNGA